MDKLLQTWIYRSGVVITGRHSYRHTGHEGGPVCSWTT